jgi:hypothetical protein
MSKRFAVLVFLFLATSSMASLILDQGLGLDGMQVGGAYTANPTGGSAVYWNAANLVNLPQSQLYTSYSNLVADVSNTTLIYNTLLNKNLAFGVGYLGVQVSGISHTGASGQSLGSDFNYNNSVTILALGYRLTEQYSIGASYKMFSQTALSEKSYHSLDIAGKLNLLNETQVGFSVENLLILNSNELSPKGRLGIEHKMDDWVLSSDLLYDALFNKLYLNSGFIYSGISLIEIKGGLNGYFGRAFLGVSLKIQDMSLDYMYSNPELGTVHSFGLAINL